MNELSANTHVAEYLPTWYAGVADYQQLAEVFSAAAETLLGNVENVHKNFYFRTMDAASVAIWERALRITPSATDTLEFRRARIINRVSMRPPYTMDFLRGRLDELIGPGQYYAYMDAGKLVIETVAGDAQYAIEVAYTVNHIKPAHIIYILRPVCFSNLRVASAVSKVSQQWNYRLGAWGLGRKKFLSESDEEVVMMASVRNVQAELLNDTAYDILQNVAAARINGTTVIYGLTKVRTDNEISISYEVTSSIGAAVTRLELLDSDENALIIAPVSIPIAGATTIKHRITVTEGDGADE